MKNILQPYSQAVILGGGGSISDLLPSDVSEYISLPSSAPLASVTIATPSGGTGPYSISGTLCQDEDGTIISVSSPSAFLRTFPVSQNKNYLLTAELSDSLGQKTYSSYLVSVAKAPALSWNAPASTAVSSGTTSTLITWNAATGGVLPYTYNTSVLSYDSSSTYSAIVSDAGLNTTISDMIGATYLLERTVTDATGSSVTVQAAVIVAPGISSITAGNGPVNQVLPAGTTSVVIGSWDAPTGGTAPYTYALTEPTGNGAIISGSGLGPYSATGLTNGRTYGFQLEITDSLGAKGYSVVTVSIAYEVPSWIIVKDVDFTDGNWTDIDSTDVTASTAVPQHILYAADGVTERCEVWNNNGQARRIRLDAGTSGLALITTSTAASPSLKVIVLDGPGQNVLNTLNWEDDLIKVELFIEGSEPLGTGGFSHISTFSRATGNSAPQHGLRLVNTGSNILTSRRSWTTSLSDKTEGSVVAGSARTYQATLEMYMTGSRTIETYARYGTPTSTPLTDLTAIPRTGRYFYHESASQPMSETPVLLDFGTSTSLNGWGFMFYFDGSFVDNDVNLSRVTVKKIRISRLPNGSKA